MYSKLPNMIYGFHGCHKDVFEKVICHGGQLDQARMIMTGLETEFIFGKTMKSVPKNGLPRDMVMMAG